MLYLNLISQVAVPADTRINHKHYTTANTKLFRRKCRSKKNTYQRNDSVKRHLCVLRFQDGILEALFRVLHWLLSNDYNRTKLQWSVYLPVNLYVGYNWYWTRIKRRSVHSDELFITLSATPYQLCLEIIFWQCEIVTACENAPHTHVQ